MKVLKSEKKICVCCMEEHEVKIMATKLSKRIDLYITDILNQITKILF